MEKEGQQLRLWNAQRISLLSHVGKMYAKVLEQRARYKAEPFLSQVQVCFRKGRDCTDAIFALRQLSEKVIEHDRGPNIVLVDQEKAFGRVNRDKLWQTLEPYNIQGQPLDTIRAIYANSMSTVRTFGEHTDWFDITSGVRQGCVLSPLLFIIYMNRITKEANLEPEALNELLLADDQSLARESEERIQEHTSSLNSTWEEYDMKISVNRTETMKVSRTPGNLNIKINDTNPKQVKEFKYLGSIFTEDSRMNREIENRIQKANNVSYQLAPLLKHSDTPIETKSKIINSIFLPTLTYQCQTWTLTKPLERKITTCEMRCFRKAVKIKRDMIPNTKIREMVGTKIINHHIQQQRIKWFGHQSNTQLNVHIVQCSVAAKQEDAPGRPGLTKSKRHYLCLTSLLLRHSDVQQTNVSFFSRRPKWYKR